MATIKYDNKAFITEVYEKINSELKRIKKNIKRDMWKKGIKKK